MVGAEGENILLSNASNSPEIAFFEANFNHKILFLN